MTLRLNGTSSGFTEIDAPAAAGSNKITLPTSNGSAEQFLKNSGTAGELEFSSMVETSNGDIGIGTASPTRDLEVSRSGNAFIRAVNSSDSVNIDIVAASSAAYVGPQSNHPLALQTNNTERARIDTAGQFQIGNNLTKTDVASTVAALVQTRFAGAFTNYSAIRESGPATFCFGRANGTGSEAVLNGNEIGTIRWAGADGTDLESQAARISCFVDGSPGSNDMPGRLVFSTTADGASSPTDRMLIAKNGQFQYFTNSNINFRCSETSASFSAIYLRNNASSISSGTTVFVVAADGDVLNTNNSYTGLSDIKLKENIVDASSQWEDLKAFRVRNYNYKEGLGYGTHTQIGLVAQEVETVSPGLVKEKPDLDDEGNDLGTVTKSVNYSVLYMKAVKALQEAQTRIETLETQNTAQQTQIDDLLARVTALEAA